MLDQAEQMARSGAKDAARQALAQLQDMLEALKAGRVARPGNSPGEQAMRRMQDLARQQQQLLDRAYRQGQQGQQGQSGSQGQRAQSGQGHEPGAGNQAGDLAAAQEALRQQLNQLRRQLGQSGTAGQSLERADRAMKGAVDALNRGNNSDATGRQGDALDQLHEAARALAEEMRDQGDEEGEGPPQMGRTDPFGRSPPGQGGMDRGDVQIPEQSEMQKSREILDELRRRAGERARPVEERNYIDRLLQRF
jgi:hypothetical protein